MQALEKTLIHNLRPENCSDVLVLSRAYGMSESYDAAYKVLSSQFRQAAKSPGFLQLDEATVCSILQNDKLIADCEEEIFENVMRWIDGHDGMFKRKSNLLIHVRYPQMNFEYLSCLKDKLHEPEPLPGMIEEALQLAALPRNAFGDIAGPQFLPPSSLRPRATAVDDNDLGGDAVRCLARFGRGLVCSGSVDGTLRTWPAGRSTACTATRPSRAFSANDGVAVLCMEAWQGLLVSGHADGALRAWDPAAGRCAHRLLCAHSDGVYALARCPVGRLASSSYDRTIRLWIAAKGARRAAAADPEGRSSWWRCERTLEGHGGLVTSLAVLPGGGGGGTLFSASLDRSIRAWRLADGAPRGVLVGHTAAVYALALVAAPRPVSSSRRPPPPPAITTTESSPTSHRPPTLAWAATRARGASGGRAPGPCW